MATPVRSMTGCSRICPRCCAAAICSCCNDTRVLPARLHGQKASGGRVELLLERLLGARRALFQLKVSHKPKAGSELELPGEARARVIGRRRRAVRARARSRRRAVSRNARPGAAAAVHRARGERSRPRALPDRVRARAGRRGRADRRPAFRPRDARRAHRARRRARVFDVARRRGYLRARPNGARRGSRAACGVA